MTDPKQTAIFPLATQSLILRPFVITEAPSKFHLDSDPQIQRYLGGPTTPDRAARVLEQEIARFELQGFGLVALVEATTQEIIGYGALQREPSTDGLEVIVGVATEACGKGYGFEAADALINAAFGPLQQSQVFGRIDPSNAASAGLVAKLGMQKVGDRTDPVDQRVEHVYAVACRDHEDRITTSGRAPRRGRITEAP